MENYPRKDSTILMRPKDSLDCSWFWALVQGVGRTTGKRYYFSIASQEPRVKIYFADEVLWEYSEDKWRE